MLLKPSQRRTLDGDGASPPPTMKVDVHPPHGVMSPMGKRPHMVGLKKPNLEFNIKKKKKRATAYSLWWPLLFPFPTLVALFKPSNPFLP